MGRFAHADRAGRAARPAAAGAAGVLLLSGLSACGGPGANSATVLERVVGVTVRHASGATVAGREGEVLRRGDTVLTGPRGSAELVTAGRRTDLLGGGALRVTNGVRADLQAGQVLVDGRSGPQLRLGLGELNVTPGSNSVVRVERGFAVRVGALAGSARVGNVAGRSVTVASYHQLMATAQALPGTAAAPLQLRDDAVELRTGLGVVVDDVALRRLAVGLDAAGDGRTLVVTLASMRLGAAVPQGHVPSARLLPFAIARAASGSDLQARVDRAESLRAAGGSWGVVARLMGTDASRTSAALDTLESLSPATTSATGPVAQAAGGPGPGPLTPRGARHPVGVRPAPRRSHRPPPRPAPSPHPSPRPSPQPSPAGPLSQLVTTVRSIVPLPSLGVGVQLGR